ncbi:glycosyltransferase family 2 protein [Synechococcus sp. CCY 0621]|uniref:glycosyltransferase family 2 protein n=1 Tax=Synechococcus sp. CCY 0621 TaxID=2815603 RepID=UPI003369D26E
MPKEPFFSIVTVTKNAEHTIERCVESVYTQKFHDLEHIIIDGLSEDRTIDRIRCYLDSAGCRISHVISEKDAGIYQAMNKGLLLAKGKWVYYLNADDYLFDSNVLANIYSILVTETCDVLYGRLLCYDHTNGNASLHAPRKINIYRLMSGGLYQQAWTFRRDFTSKIGGFDEGLRICGDIDFLMRLVRADARVSVSAIILSVFRRGGASSDFSAVKSEHKLVERRYCSSLTRFGFKLWRNTIRFGVSIMRSLGQNVTD